MQTKWDFAGSTDMWSTSAGGHLMKVVNLTGFTVLAIPQSDSSEHSTRIFLSRPTSAPRGKEEQCEAEGVQNCEVKAVFSNSGAGHKRSGAGGDATPVVSTT
jgi:hypothetical protein